MIKWTGQCPCCELNEERAQCYESSLTENLSSRTKVFQCVQCRIVICWYRDEGLAVLMPFVGLENELSKSRKLPPPGTLAELAVMDELPSASDSLFPPLHLCRVSEVVSNENLRLYTERLRSPVNLSDLGPTASCVAAYRLLRRCNGKSRGPTGKMLSALYWRCISGRKIIASPKDLEAGFRPSGLVDPRYDWNQVRPLLLTLISTSCPLEARESFDRFKNFLMSHLANVEKYTLRWSGMLSAGLIDDWIYCELKWISVVSKESSAVLLELNRLLRGRDVGRVDPEVLVELYPTDWCAVSLQEMNRLFLNREVGRVNPEVLVEHYPSDWCALSEPEARKVVKNFVELSGDLYELGTSQLLPPAVSNPVREVYRFKDFQIGDVQKKRSTLRVLESWSCEVVGLRARAECQISTWRSRVLRPGFKEKQRSTVTFDLRFEDQISEWVIADSTTKSIDNYTSWDGRCLYDDDSRWRECGSFGFVLHMSIGRFGRFTGCVEEEVKGKRMQADVKGVIWDSKVKFTKVYRNYWEVDNSGGLRVRQDLPTRLVTYSGEFNMERTELSGTWSCNRHYTSPLEGSWSAKKR